jgi:osmotically-inducible protein OsmY
MSRLPTLLIGAAAGAAAAHFLDPDSGARRRNALRERGASKARSGAAGVQAQAQYVAGQAKGAASAVTPSPTRVEDADDVTLARKVETEIFRPADAPKGDVSVDVEAGIAYLRGTVADEAWIERFAEGARKVDGIKGVKNLLHAPGTPAPAPEPRGAIQDRLG